MLYSASQETLCQHWLYHNTGGQYEELQISISIFYPGLFRETTDRQVKGIKIVARGCFELTPTCLKPAPICVCMCVRVH